MNQMWADMTDLSREEYRQYFIAYHDSVSRYLPKLRQGRSSMFSVAKAILLKSDGAIRIFLNDGPTMVSTCVPIII
jgi:hypothetical protein